MKGRLHRALLGLSLTAALGLLGAAACNPTAGVPITLSLAFEGLGREAVTTPSGWEVELTEATLLLGPIYAYAPLDEADGAMARATSLRGLSGLRALRALVGPGVAFAHGGFDPLSGRLVRAEALDQHAVDALEEGPVVVASLGGLQGEIEELSLILEEPLGDFVPESGPTHGHHLWVRGSARRDGVELAFEGGLDLSAEDLSRRVDGVAVEGPAFLDEGTTLIVGVDPRGWLGEADFTALADSGADPAVIVPDSQPYRAWRLAARNAAAYSSRVE